MKTKKLFVLSLLVTVLFCGAFVSAASAEDQIDPTRAPDPSTISDEGLIAPGPDDPTSSDDGNVIYYTTGGNETAPTEDPAPNAEDADLIYALDEKGADNTIAIAVAGILSVIVACSAIGVVCYRRSAHKQA